MDIVQRVNGLSHLGAAWVLWLLVALSVVGVAIVIERAVVLCNEKLISPEDLSLSSPRRAEGIEAGMTLDEVSRILLRKSLEMFEGNKTKAADSMGVSLRWIHYKTKEWKL